MREMEEQRRAQAEAQAKAASYQHDEAASAITGDQPQEAAEEPEAAQPFVRDGEKVGRNDPCPCGSGKKFKHCHGKLN